MGIRAEEPYVWEGESQHMETIGQWVCGFGEVCVLVRGMPLLESSCSQDPSDPIFHTTVQLEVALEMGG